MKNARRHRGEKSSVYPGAPVSYCSWELRCQVTSLVFFGRKAHQCTHLLISCPGRGPDNRVCETGCVDTWKDAVKLSEPPPSSLVAGLPHAGVPVTPRASTHTGCRRGLKPPRLCLPHWSRAVSTLRSTLSQFATGTVRPPNLSPSVS